MEMFEKAEEAEQSETGRSFPMAIWGAVMSTTQILWQYSDCEKGKEYLKKIPKDANWTTVKEKAYIKTALALYPNNLPCKNDSQFAREERFMNSMKLLTKEFPEETDAALFHAVASTAVAAHPKQEGEGEESEDNKEKITKALQILEQKLPTHSGLLHYIIHVFDTPEFFAEGNKLFLDQMIKPSDQRDHVASMGIRAADKYPQVANSSCHALHMPSHIYMRIGDWSRSLKSNLLSIQVIELNITFFELEII